MGDKIPPNKYNNMSSQELERLLASSVLSDKEKRDIKIVFNSNAGDDGILNTDEWVSFQRGYGALDEGGKEKEVKEPKSSWGFGNDKYNFYKIVKKYFDEYGGVLTDELAKTLNSKNIEKVGKSEEGNAIIEFKPDEKTKIVRVIEYNKEGKPTKIAYKKNNTVFKTEEYNYENNIMVEKKQNQIITRYYDNTMKNLNKETIENREEDTFTKNVYDTKTKKIKESERYKDGKFVEKLIFKKDSLGIDAIYKCDKDGMIQEKKYINKYKEQKTEIYCEGISTSAISKIILEVEKQLKASNPKLYKRGTMPNEGDILNAVKDGIDCYMSEVKRIYESYGIEDISNYKKEDEPKYIKAIFSYYGINEENLNKILQKFNLIKTGKKQETTDISLNNEDVKIEDIEINDILTDVNNTESDKKAFYTRVNTLRRKDKNGNVKKVAFSANWVLEDSKENCSKTYDEWEKNLYKKELRIDYVNLNKLGRIAQKKPLITPPKKTPRKCGRFCKEVIIQVFPDMAGAFEGLGDASQFAAVFANSKHFAEVPHNIVAIMDLNTLPKGAIFVYDANYKSDGGYGNQHQSGHTGFSNGKGEQNGDGCYSIYDFDKEKQSTHIRVFIPVMPLDNLAES